MEAIITTALVAFAIALSLILGNWLPLVLPQISSSLDRKPFNCRPCTTFHLSLFSFVLVAHCVASWWLVVVGVVVAFIIFIILRTIDNNKIVK